jgi:aryl-alcohol dehydrogenase-like predicted oxidoreductase
MKYNVLGNTGLLVSELCLGTMTFGGKGFWKVVGTQTQKDADKLVGISLEKGINFFDTSNNYSEGLSEQILGNALKNSNVDPYETVVATKLRIRVGPGVNQVGLSRAQIKESVNASLKRLQLDHIDLLYLHGVDLVTPLEETMRGLEDEVRSGRVRYLGICNHPAWMVTKANGIAEKNGWTKFSAAQCFYSLAARDIEYSILPMAISEKLSILPWSPLAGGFLSGKYDRNTTTAGDSRRDLFDYPPINKERAYDIIDVLKKLAASHEVSAAQVALRWLISQNGITSTIIGASNEKQLRDNINATELILTDNEMDMLDKVSRMPIIYPGWMMDSMSLDRLPAEKDGK